MRVILLIPLLAGLGGLTACTGSVSSGRSQPWAELSWHTDLDAAIREARRVQKPLYVLSILGDIKKRC